MKNLVAWWTTQRCGFLMLRAQLAQDARNYQRSIELLEKAVSLNPKLDGAWNNLGTSFMGLVKWADAERALKRALELNPSNTLSLHNLGTVCMAQGKIEDALLWFRKSVELDPEFVPGWAKLGLWFTKANRYEEAIRPLKEAVRIMPNEWTYWGQLAGAYKHTGQIELEKEAVDRASTLSPSLVQNPVGKVYQK